MGIHNQKSVPNLAFTTRGSITSQKNVRGRSCYLAACRLTRTCLAPSPVRLFCAVRKVAESLRHGTGEWLKTERGTSSKGETERDFPCWCSGHFNRHFNGQSVQLSHQCRWTCVQQFSPLLAVLFFCSCVCNGVNSWTPLLLTHVLSLAPSLSFTLPLSWLQVKAACFYSTLSQVFLNIKWKANHSDLFIKNHVSFIRHKSEVLAVTVKLITDDCGYLIYQFGFHGHFEDEQWPQQATLSTSKYIYFSTKAGNLFLKLPQTFRY